MNTYGLKIIYQYTVENTLQSIFFEEQVVMLNAQDFDMAYEKAWKYAEEYCDTHINPDGDKVVKSVYDIVDCYLSDDEDTEIIEVYSSIKKNRTDMSNDEFVDVLADGCSVEEMKVLRYC